jgi:transposase
VSSVKRALHRHGYVVKKRRRALENLRPDVVAKREQLLRKIHRIPFERLIFLDESGMNVSMSRSRGWVKRGEEFVDRIPMNWGKNRTLLGAIRLTGWVVLTTMFQTANKDRFVQWLKTKLLPKLRRGDVIVMDNLAAHHDHRVGPACKARGVRIIYLPPYSPDFNPIESGWLCRSSTSAASHLATPTRFVALPGARGIASPRLIVGSGSLTAATRVNPGDLWG